MCAPRRRSACGACAFARGGEGAVDAALLRALNELHEQWYGHGAHDGVPVTVLDADVPARRVAAAAAAAMGDAARAAAARGARGVLLHVVGNIGAGKSTALAALGRLAPAAHFVDEPVAEWGGALAAMYAGALSMAVFQGLTASTERELPNPHD